jgi:hypothetical protein
MSIQWTVSEDDVRQKTLDVIGLGSMGNGTVIALPLALTGIMLPPSAAQREAA